MLNVVIFFYGAVPAKISAPRRLGSGLMGNGLDLSIRNGARESVERIVTILLIKEVPRITMPVQGVRHCPVEVLVTDVLSEVRLRTEACGLLQTG